MQANMGKFLNQASKKVDGSGFDLKAVFVTFDKESDAEKCLAESPKGWHQSSCFLLAPGCWAYLLRLYLPAVPWPHLPFCRCCWPGPCMLTTAHPSLLQAGSAASSSARVTGSWGSTGIGSSQPHRQRMLSTKT